MKSLRRAIVKRILGLSDDEFPVEEYVEDVGSDHRRIREILRRRDRYDIGITEDAENGSLWFRKIK